MTSAAKAAAARQFLGAAKAAPFQPHQEEKKKRKEDADDGVRATLPTAKKERGGRGGWRPRYFTHREEGARRVRTMASALFRGLVISVMSHR